MKYTCYQCKNKYCCNAYDWNPTTGVRIGPCDEFELDESYEEADA